MWCEQDDSGLGAVRTDLVHALDDAEDRQLRFENDDLRTMELRLANRGLAIVRFGHDIEPVALEQGANALPHQPMLRDDQDSQHSATLRRRPELRKIWKP